MTIFFTSDLHFGHRNIVDFCNRPFVKVVDGARGIPEYEPDVEAMNAGLVANWNAVVTNNDTVFVLGDFAMGKISETLPIALRLNGTKMLVPGNHDRCFSESSDSEKWIKRYQDVGFIILAEQWFVKLSNELTVKVCHFPYSMNAHDSRYANKLPKDEGDWLLSGHVHDAWKFQKRNINVGTDVWGLAPVSEHEIAHHIRTSK